MQLVPSTWMIEIRKSSWLLIDQSWKIFPDGICKKHVMVMHSQCQLNKSTMYMIWTYSSTWGLRHVAFRGQIGLQVWPHHHWDRHNKDRHSNQMWLSKGKLWGLQAWDTNPFHLIWDISQLNRRNGIQIISIPFYWIKPEPNLKLDHY